MSEARKLRIGLLHFTGPPIVGGVEAIVGRQATGLAGRGHEVLVLAGRGRAVPGGGRYCRLAALDSKYPPLLEINRELRAGRVPAAFEALREDLGEALGPILAELDVCIVHNALTLHFNLPLTAALHELASRPGAPGLVGWSHDLSWTNPLYRPIVYDRYPWNLLKTPAPNTTYVVVSDDRQRDLARLAGLPPERLAVIPAGVDIGRKLGLGIRTTRLLADFKLLEADPFIILPVRITRRKNIELAIRVVAALRALGRPVRLLVTGPRGPHDPASIRYLDELERLRRELDVTESVVLLQSDPSPDGRYWRPSDRMMDELYRAADVMLLPSAQEGFGIPVLEAGLVGLPTFCSDIAPFHEIAGDDVSYFGLESDPALLAAEIVRFVEQDGRYHLRKRVQREYSWDKILDQRLIPLLCAAARATGRT